MNHTVQIATHSEQVRQLGIGRHIATSFDHLDANRYLAGDEPAQRLDIMSAYFGMLAEHAADGAGQVLYISDPNGSLAAAAVWFDLTAEPPAFDTYEQQLAALARDHLPHFQLLDEVFEAHHPQDKHRHLAFLAVTPDRQGQGLGSHLLKHTHAELDEAGIPAYLEATNERNADLYRANGYVDMEPFEIHVGPVTFFRMWRPPVTA